MEPDVLRTEIHRSAIRAVYWQIEQEMGTVLAVWRNSSDPHLKAVLDNCWNRLREASNSALVACEFYDRVNGKP